MVTNKNDKFAVNTICEDGSCTIYMHGELDLSVAPDFRKMIEPFVTDQNTKLVLNLKELKYIDSTGIGILLSILKARNSMNAGFYIEEVPGQIQKLFDMTGITKFFTVQENS